MPVSLSDLETRLGKTGGDYLCLSDLPGNRVRVQFVGRFDGREVAWDATFRTLRHCWQERAAGMPVRAYMEITPLADDACRIEVGLDLPVIDEPAIRKIIIMVRNYKRLRSGRMEWGEAIEVIAGPEERV
jgi:hypothetical protein